MTDDIPFAIEVDDCTPPVVRVSGDIDLATRDAVRAVIVGLREAGRSERLIFDMTRVTFIDSSGLAILLGAVNEGTAVTLRNPSRIVRRIVSVTGLDDVLALET